MRSIFSGTRGDGAEGGGMATLISLAGLPGSGKSTIGKQLSRMTGAVFLRVDEIEAVMWAHEPGRDLGPEGYQIAASLARSNLSLGHDVIVDCVNPWPMTRGMFAAAAQDVSAQFLGVELVCSNERLHRGRLESREPEVSGLSPVSWQDVLSRRYSIWDGADLRIDTALITVCEAVALIRDRLNELR